MPLLPHTPIRSRPAVDDPVEVIAGAVLDRRALKDVLKDRRVSFGLGTIDLGQPVDMVLLNLFARVLADEVLQR